MNKANKITNEIMQVFAVRWRVFLLSLVVQLVLSLLIHLGVQTPRQLNFLALPTFSSRTSATTEVPAPTIDPLSKIKQKLETKPNNFQLKNDSSMIPTAYAASDYDGANAYIAVNLANGQVLAGKNTAAPLPVASVTKIMSAVVALDLAAPDEEFTISARAAGMEPTKIGVIAGQKMTLTELLDASLMTSANDAMQVIADGIDQKYGQTGLFVRAMNAKAQFLGLQNSHFTNPQGLDDGQPYSSAADLATLAAYALQNYPLIGQIVQKDYQFLPADQNHKQFDLYNWNGLLDVYPGAYGVKIGNTDTAGYTTVVAAKRNGQNVLAVVLGAPGVLERDMWAADLLDNAFEELGVPLAGITQQQLQAKYATWKYWQ